MKRVSEGVSGPGRKLSVCTMLKEEMETLEGAGRETHTTAQEDSDVIRIIIIYNIIISYHSITLHH